MNRFLFLMMLIPAAAAAQWKTQPATAFKVKPVLITADTSKPNVKAPYNWLAQGKRMHTNQYGTVYSMPPDNMPCIVPHVQANAPMPAKRSRINDPMPNGIMPPRIKPDKE